MHVLPLSRLGALSRLTKMLQPSLYYSKTCGVANARAPRAQDVQLEVQLLPLPGWLSVLKRVGDAVGASTPMRVGLGSLIFSGRLRVALKPLMSQLPIVAAMQARVVHSTVRGNM